MYHGGIEKRVIDKCKILFLPIRAGVKKHNNTIVA
jgi:hypothetical protein